MKYYIKENYYFDIDHNNQLRVTGPGNHLLLGIRFPEDLDIEIESYELTRGQLVIGLSVPTRELKIHTPLVTDIRTLRKHIEPVKPRPTYDTLVENNVTAVLPKKVEQKRTKEEVKLRFYNDYADKSGKLRRYGAEIIVPKPFKATLSNGRVEIRGEKEVIPLTIKTISRVPVERRLLRRRKIFRTKPDLPENLFNSFLLDIYAEAKIQILHLVRAKKTSSFEYGTIFPRDWIESADLGKNDFTARTVDYLYEQSMKHVSELGEGWHEDVVGEYLAKLEDESAHIDRKMVDIEPRYIMGARVMSKQLLTKEETHRKLLLVSKFLLNNAKEHEFVTFKRVPHTENQYHFVGNWRDSYFAFPRQQSPLAPYDVNCVFYPVSLRVIREYYDYFQVEDVKEIDALIDKWDKQKNKFRLYHPNGIIGYSLALHTRKNRPLTITHIDESYDLFYGSPSLEEIASFSTKIVDPDYFYTPVGPILVGSDEEEHTTHHYHGKVIWPKQAAYCVAGLARQYRRGKREGWPGPVMESIREAITITSEACFKGWEDLEAVPELYYYDEEANKARFFTDQVDYEGQMSLIQLWSSVGARRIMQEYAFIRGAS